MKSRLVVLALLSVLVSACSKSSTEAGSSDPLAVGSSYNFITTTTDQYGVPQAAPGASSLTVTANNQSIGGRSGVVALANQQGSIQYQRYPASGDLEYWQSVSLDGQQLRAFWMNFPFVTHTPATYTMDSTWSDFGKDTMQYSQTVAYAGEGSVVVAGKAFATHKMQCVLHMHAKRTLYQVVDAIDTFEYSPELKQMIKQVIHQTSDDQFNGHQSQIYTTTLASYTLK